MSQPPRPVAKVGLSQTIKRQVLAAVSSGTCCLLLRSRTRFLRAGIRTGGAAERRCAGHHLLPAFSRRHGLELVEQVSDPGRNSGRAVGLTRQREEEDS